MVDELTPKRPYLRILRISWTVGWSILAVLLVVAWIRSYWYVDFWYVKTPGIAIPPGIAWMQGFVFFDCHIIHPTRATVPPWRTFGPVNVMTIWNPHGEGIFKIEVEGRFIQLWILAPIAIGLAALPWVYRRYSLRRILVLMTVIAVLLGLSRWSALRYLRHVNSPELSMERF